MFKACSKRTNSGSRRLALDRHPYKGCLVIHAMGTRLHALGALLYNDNVTNETPLINDELLVPMQCDSLADWHELREQDLERYVVEPKFDGFRLVTRTHMASVDSYTRELKKQNGKLPYVDEQLLRLAPPDTVFDGEIVAYQVNATTQKVDNDFEHVQSIMLSKPDRAVQVANETRKLNYVIFDVLVLGGEDMRNLSLWRRKEFIERMYDWHFERFDDFPNIKIAKGVPGREAAVDAWVDQGYEGAIFKDQKSKYLSGGRGKGWYKYKPQSEIDVIITGYVPGEGKYVGMVGGIRFSQPDPTTGNLVERGSCSGMTDEVRRDITANADRLERTVMTIKHHGTYKSSPRVRHPQFLRLRPDKTAVNVFWHDK